jgi:hypothetical protein
MTDEENKKQEKAVNTIRVSYQFGDRRMEAEGPADEVNKHTLAFFSLVAPIEHSGHLVSELNGNTPLLGESNGVPSPDSTDVEAEPKPLDLLTFYQKKAPKGQRDEILVITYFYQKFLNYEALSLDDYQEAYKTLRRLAIPEPSNYKSSVRNVVDRTDLLYTPIRGKFGLTLPGDNYVEGLPQE